MFWLLEKIQKNVLAKGALLELKIAIRNALNIIAGHWCVKLREKKMLLAKS